MHTGAILDRLLQHACLPNLASLLTPQITIGPQGYPGESDLSPNAFPFPANAPVEGAYTYCPDNVCGGDRHVLIVDNGTCMLYEMWRR